MIVGSPRSLRWASSRSAADESRWSRHRVTIDEAVAGGCNIQREELRAAIADEATWRACYLCEFVDEQYSLLPFDLLEAIFRAHGPPSPATPASSRR